MIFRMLILTLISVLAQPASSWTDPKDALVNPRGRKVCLQQCGSSALKCPEAFWKEQVNMCYRCCATWGETVIKVQCDESRTNVTKLRTKEKKPVKSEEDGAARELGFS